MCLVLKVEQLVLKQQFKKKGLKMFQIHFDDFGAQRLFTQNMKQNTGIIAGSNLSNVPVSLGNIGHFLPDGFQYNGPTGNFIFVAIRKN